jgi:adenosylcobyric acid synthase
LKSAKKIVGICGGFQMLSERIEDPEMVQATLRSYEGLGLLKCKFTYRPVKTTRAVSYEIRNSHIACGREAGYEIHYGELSESGEEPLCLVDGKGEGAISHDGRVIGTNIHGILENPCFLKYVLGQETEERYWNSLNKNLDLLADLVRKNVDLSDLLTFLSSGK